MRKVGQAAGVAICWLLLATALVRGQERPSPDVVRLPALPAAELPSADLPPAAPPQAELPFAVLPAAMLSEDQLSEGVLLESELLEGGTAGDEVSTPTALPDKRGSGRSGGGPGMGPPGYKASWYPSQAVSNENTDLGFVRQHLSGGFPIWREESDTILLMTGVRNTLFSTDAILPDTLRPFPEELWNISLGLMHIHKFDNGWTSGISGTFGSASDKPFHSIAEMNLGFFGFLQVPAKSERDAWMYSLMYSPTGNLTFPIPGVAYSWKPSDDFHLNLGLPFSLMWKPRDQLTFNLSYIPITNVNARVTYEMADGFNVYGGFEWLNEAYFLADRAEDDERFLAFEKRLICGICWNVRTHLALDVNGGYAFDRYYGEGENQISDLHDRVDVAPGPFAGANLLVQW